MLSSQYRPAGTWRYYTNNQDFYEIENINNHLYINAKRLLYDIKLDPFEKNSFDRTTGLSDYSISTMSYSETAQKLIVVYANTMIDIFSFKDGNKKITPNFDVYNKLVVADKSILQVKFYNDKAYLCSKLGVIILDYDKNEIDANYIIGTSGQFLAVNTLEIIDNKIYVATPLGVKVGLIHPAINLQDFNNWSASLTTIPNDTFFRSNVLQGKSYWMSQHTFYEYDGTTATQLISKDTLRQLVQLRRIKDKLYIVYDSLDATKQRISSKVIAWNGQKFEEIKKTKGDRLYDVNLANDKYYFTGDGYYKNLDGDAVERDRLSGVPLDYPFRLQIKDKTLTVNMGIMYHNLDATRNKEGHYTYGKPSWANNEEYVWQHFGIWDDSLSDCSNEVATIERDGGKYRAFVRGGVAFEKDKEKTKRYRTHNSPLEPDNLGEYRMSDMVLNPLDQSIWFANSSSSNPLKCLTKEGKWYSFELASVTNTREIYRIIIDSGGNKWLLTRNEGLILFNEKDIENKNDDIIRQFLEIKNAKSGKCALNIRSPLCGAIDKDYNLWIGTDKGIGFISNCTYDASDECDMNIPVQSINNPNDTTVYTECAFLNTPVTAIAIDRGNNIWVGTPDGLFYNQDYVSSEYIRLNKLNSPLSSSTIHDVVVHPENGEVFISTEVGLLSYMGQSTSGVINEGLSPYRVIPNPVPRDYDGLVTIDGLPEEGYFKITDVIGNVMYQGETNGSRVTWDTRSLNGYKVPTGVYYIFCSKSQMRGKQGVGSFTIIR